MTEASDIVPDDVPQNAPQRVPPMTLRQERFVREYFKDFNGEAAAIRAGYSAATATQAASRLLTKVNVRLAIQGRQSSWAARSDIKQERILSELAAIAFANMADYTRVQGEELVLDFSEMTREQAAAIQEITSEVYTEGRGEDAREVKRTKFKLAPKTPALELLAKHLGMLIEKHSVTVEHKSEILEKLYALIAVPGDTAKIVDGTASPASSPPSAKPPQAEG